MGAIVLDGRGHILAVQERTGTLTQDTIDILAAQTGAPPSIEIGTLGTSHTTRQRRLASLQLHVVRLSKKKGSPLFISLCVF